MFRLSGKQDETIEWDNILSLLEDDDQLAAIEKKFPALQQSIPGIVSIEWGTNNSPEGLNKDFTHCFIVTFESEDARSNYLPHPNHQAFVDILKPLLDDVFVIDFNLWKLRACCCFFVSASFPTYVLNYQRLPFLAPIWCSSKTTPALFGEKLSHQYPFL